MASSFTPYTCKIPAFRRHGVQPPERLLIQTTRLQFPLKVSCFIVMQAPAPQDMFIAIPLSP
jgi:hypothetical protein